MKLSLGTKIAYRAGDTGFNLTSTMLGAYFLIFLNYPLSKDRFIKIAADPAARRDDT